MADEIYDKLDLLETPGTMNSNKRSSTRTTQTARQASSNISYTGQTVDKIIRKEQDRLSGINSRNALVIAKTTPSEYEKVRYSVGTTANTDDTTDLDDLKKIWTRNPESKCFFITAPWEYDDTDFGIYKKEITRLLHTSTIIDAEQKNELGDPWDGDFFNILYDDQTQDTAKIIKREGKGLGSLPLLNSPSVAFKSYDMWDGTDINVKVGDTTKSSGSLGTSDARDIQVKASGSIVNEIQNDNLWSPKYNPIAVPAGDPNPRTGSPFGFRNHPTKKVYTWHKGVDMNPSGAGAPRGGYPIIAVAKGKIKQIKPDDGQPTTLNYAYVEIEHEIKKPYKVSTVYGHIFLIGEKNGKRLEVGDAIEAGQVIGYLGGDPTWPGSGNTTGPHLHFEVHVSKTVDGKKQYDQSYDSVEKERKEMKQVNPTFFKYPNIAHFNKTQIERLRLQTPNKLSKTEIEEEEDKLISAADSAVTQEQREKEKNLSVPGR